MKNYIGSKIIKAQLSNLAEYKRIKYGTSAQINEFDSNIEVYIVYYPGIGDDNDLYISCSPKSVFECAYREIHPEEEAFIKGNYDINKK